MDYNFWSQTISKVLSSVYVWDDAMSDVAMNTCDFNLSFLRSSFFPDAPTGRSWLQAFAITTALCFRQEWRHRRLSLSSSSSRRASLRYAAGGAAANCLHRRKCSPSESTARRRLLPMSTAVRRRTDLSIRRHRPVPRHRPPTADRNIRRRRPTNPTELGVSEAGRPSYSNATSSPTTSPGARLRVTTGTRRPTIRSGTRRRRRPPRHGAQASPTTHSRPASSSRRVPRRIWCRRTAETPPPAARTSRWAACFCRAATSERRAPTYSDWLTDWVSDWVSEWVSEWVSDTGWWPQVHSKAWNICVSGNPTDPSFYPPPDLKNFMHFYWRRNLLGSISSCFLIMYHLSTEITKRVKAKWK